MRQNYKTLGQFWESLYLQVSIENGQDDRSINWLQHKLTVADFKNSNWEGVKAALIGKFGESFTYLQYRQKLMRMKQPNGEYLNMYVDRYVDLMTKAKFADGPWAVMHFLGTLLVPVKDCLERKLAEIRAKKNADFILEDDSRMQEDLPWFEKSGKTPTQVCQQ
ncbi:hypothetical protein G6F57_018993 [Rhizopus arrhizus]|nr:hypothetical protein G6F30_014061 [Rhizopus arrhizus]KAG1000368.1 hypothetical protein G6F27_013765 [Rhizopus arrhizus]KAG1017799.1 hypothetical protein G6F25_013847 [Rhizopus arrhizus]KAG1081740.1 hypothetical protein G6F39_013818 [Rhizopus arrhizus]KAG1392197.1 hypothetical protein G6F59_014665 [Rhizopus arrhizus]